MAIADGTFSSTRTQTLASLREGFTVESERLLNEAAGLRMAATTSERRRGRVSREQRLITMAAPFPPNDAWAVAMHAHVDLRIRHDDSLVRSWQLEVQARHATINVALERLAIGADALPSPEPRGK